MTICCVVVMRREKCNGWSPAEVSDGGGQRRGGGQRGRRPVTDRRYMMTHRRVVEDASMQGRCVLALGRGARVLRVADDQMVLKGALIIACEQRGVKREEGVNK